MKDLKLSEIWIYPVKSLGGIRLTSAKVLGKGLQYDRRFMLVDSDNKFITQRVHASMALFKMSIEEDNLLVHYHDDTLTVPLEPAIPGPPVTVQIWDDTVIACETDHTINQWFSERLKFDCRLVYFPEANARPVDARYSIHEEHVSLADAYPLLLIGQSSLDDLNTRLAEPVPMNRFRPNLVFTGGDAYEEDGWKKFSIAGCGFAAVKPCARCVLITVDQETAKKGAEPLKTLARYRTRDNKVYFGQNILAFQEMIVNEGDTITLSS
jgi:hypothetical protein